MKRIRLAAVILIVVLLISTGIWWLVSSGSAEVSSDILASGFIEARDVAVAFEAGGRIVEIAAEEGDRVEAGMPLVKLDDSLLQAQRQQAEAAVRIARAALEQAVASRNQAEVSANATRKIWENALDVLANPLELDARIVAAQGELDRATVDLARVNDLRLPDYWQRRAAETRRDVAQNVLDNLVLIKNDPQEIKAVEANASAAYQAAVAAKAVADKGVKLAESQVEQSEASLAVIKVQLSKLTFFAPISGVLAARDAEVGEIARPGASILTITEVDKVTLTAYVPESKLGLVKLGQRALVSVDSYPGDRFPGSRVYISPEAQFTPKNVQLKEEREKTVFAVKISLANPDQKLKPGMPADVRISTNP